jgi:uncharacterized membrane protein YeaQ/YmgE (transglycosylase-associated protein family)
MLNIDIVSLILFIIGGFFAGVLFQIFRQRQQQKQAYGHALTLFIFGVVFIVLILLYLYRQA